MRTENFLIYLTSGMILTFFLVVIFVLFGSIFGLHINTGEGTHSGYVTAVQTTGIIFDTNEVFFKTDTSTTQEDMYCVVDSELLEKLRDVSASNSRVEIGYIKYLANGITTCSGQLDIITSVREI